MIPTFQLGQFGLAGRRASQSLAGSAALAFSLVGSMDAGAALAGSSAITFTPTGTLAAVDAHYASVVLLLHGEGADGSTTATNNASNGLTLGANGNAQVDTAQFKYGSASLLYDGNGDFWTIGNHADFNFGTGDFTIECFVRFNGVGTAQALASTYQNSTNGWSLELSSAKMIFNATGDGVDLQGTSTLTTNTWYHVAVSRTGTTLKLFVDGTEEHSVTNSANITSTAVFATGRLGGLGADYMDGWIDEMRITKGVGRYTANFTVPAAAFPDS